MRMAALTKSAMLRARAESTLANHGLALALGRALVAAALHDGRVQIQVMGHHRGAKNADGDIEHARVSDN